MKTQLPTLTVQLNPNVTPGELGAITALLMNHPEVVRVELPREKLSKTVELNSRMYVGV